VYFRSLAECTPWLSWGTLYLNLFSADFRSCSVARSRKPIKYVLKTLLRRSMHAVPIRPQKTNGSSQGCGSGPFSAEARKFYRFRFHVGYLTWRVTWRKIFVHFPMWMWIKRWSCTISLNEHAISVARGNEKKHRGKSASTSHFLWYRA